MPQRTRAFAVAAGLLLFIEVAGCASRRLASEPPPSPAVPPVESSASPSPPAAASPSGFHCSPPLEPYVKATLYMGRGSRDPAEWQQFVDEVLVRHFPDGGTMIQTAGWWEGRSGASGDDNSRMLVMLHPLAERDAFAGSVQAVITAIKERFGHRAVLWEEAAVCASI